MEVLGASVFFLTAGAIAITLLFIFYKLYIQQKELITKWVSYIIIIGLVIGFSITYLALYYRVDKRTSTSSSYGISAVKTIWGGEISQSPPTIRSIETILEKYVHPKTGVRTYKKKKIYKRVKLEKCDIKVKLDKDIRKKGLLTYSGYQVMFNGIYTFKNPFKKAMDIEFTFPLPQNSGKLSDFKVTHKGKEYREDQDVSDGFNWIKNLLPNQVIHLTISYKARGLNSWIYLLANKKEEIPYFKIELRTDYTNLDYPKGNTYNSRRNMAGSMTPSKNEEMENQSLVVWEFKNLITTQNVGIKVPQEENVWKIIGKIYLYAPLSLFLFTLSLFVYTRAKDISLHVVNYLFLLAGFSIFMFLLSYIVTYLSFTIGFLISFGVAASSVTYYSFLLKKGNELIFGTGISLLMFQFLFSLAFFFPKHTGFIIVIGGIISIFILMKMTAKVDWKGKF